MGSVKGIFSVYGIFQASVGRTDVASMPVLMPASRANTLESVLLLSSADCFLCISVAWSF